MYCLYIYLKIYICFFFLLCSFSLFGVCLMAFHQAQYILSEFSSASIRSSHNSVLSRDNSSVNNITPNGVKYVQVFLSYSHTTWHFFS